MKIDPDLWLGLSRLLDQWLELLEESRGAWLDGLGPEYANSVPMLRQMKAAQMGIDAGGFLDTHYGSRQFALIIKALADPKRFEMLQRIAGSKQASTCSSVCEWLGLAPATVSRHLRELESAGLVNVQRDGKFAYTDGIARHLDKGTFQSLRSRAPTRSCGDKVCRLLFT
jgi:DNA-binding transcriptional ArsR family regulator